MSEDTVTVETYEQGTGRLLKREQVKLPPEAVEARRREKRRAELKAEIESAYKVGTIPPPDLSTFLLKIAEYLALEG